MAGTDARGTGHRATESRGTVHRLADRLTPEAGSRTVDQTRASLQTSAQRLLPMWSNRELIEEARRLNRLYFQPDVEVGPKEKNAIVDTLKLIMLMLERRIVAAPKRLVPGDSLPLPRLEGIVWKKDDPLAGSIQGIDPFQMVDWWLHRDVPTERRAEPRKKPVDSTPAPPVHYDRDPLIQVPSRPTITFPIFVARCLQALSKPPLSNEKKRMRCMMRRLLLAKVDDRYVDGSIVYLFTPMPGRPRRRVPDPDLLGNRWPHLRQKLELNMDTHYVSRDDRLVRTLLYLEHTIYQNFALIRQRMLIQNKAIDPWIVRLNDWISSQQRNEKSLYACFR